MDINKKITRSLSMCGLLRRLLYDHHDNLNANVNWTFVVAYKMKMRDF